MATPSITLSAAQVAELKEFCVSHLKKEFFLAKDQGAYVGACGEAEDGSMENCIFYFRGCNPETDDDWYETSRDKFGGDDFGEYLPVAWLNLPAGVTKMRIIAGKRSVKAEYLA